MQQILGGGHNLESSDNDARRHLLNMDGTTASTPSGTYTYPFAVKLPKPEAERAGTVEAFEIVDDAGKS